MLTKLFNKAIFVTYVAAMIAVMAVVWGGIVAGVYALVSYYVF